jgi:hypothetical protein
MIDMWPLWRILTADLMCLCDESCGEWAAEIEDTAAEATFLNTEKA